MIEIMDLDLWQWHLPASIGVDCNAESGWEFDSDLCNVPDILEENAINEKCCIQALNHLIAKADAEIFDLEDDLAILNSQLSWAKHDEHEKLYEVWCASFREKITSLSRFLQTSMKESALDNHALNAGSGINHAPIERIHDIIFPLLEHNFPKENRKECRIIHADIEVREKTTASASLGLSRMMDNNVGTENQPVIDKIKEEKGLHILDVRLTQKHGQAFERESLPTISMPDCNKKVSDNEIKDGSFALQGEKGLELIPFQQNCGGTDELDPALRADPQWPSVKVEFDEHEPLIMFLSSHGSKRKKFQTNPARSRNKFPEEVNRKKLCMNETGAAATASSMRKLASEGNGKKFGMDRKSAKGKLPLHMNENSIQNSGPARGARSLIALSIEIKSSSLSSHSADLQEGNSPLEKDTQETTVSESTAISKLEKMNCQELRAMAKNYGLKGYHKLKKSLLVDMIVHDLGKK